MSKKVTRIFQEQALIEKTLLKNISEYRPTGDEDFDSQVRQHLMKDVHDRSVSFILSLYDIAWDILRNRIIPLFHRVAGSNETFPEDMFDIFNVRNVDRDKREDYLFAAIEYYKPDLVILDGIQCLPHMKPTIILETSYKDVGNMMWWGFRNAPRFKSQKALYLLLSGAERSKDNFILLLSLA